MGAMPVCERLRSHSLKSVRRVLQSQNQLRQPRRFVYPALVIYETTFPVEAQRPLVRFQDLNQHRVEAPPSVLYECSAVALPLVVGVREESANQVV